jgi:hypothetical protein
VNTPPAEQDKQVWRITVDERLTEDLIRIEVCHLAYDTNEFGDRVGEWTGARGVFIHSDDYLDVMGIPDDQADQWPWESLTEGMSFIAGAFVEPPAEPVEGQPAAVRFRVAPERRAFTRIDNRDPLRDSLKEIYSLLLTGGRNEHAD